MKTELVTILVPNYKTLELTKLCLRLLRKYTTPGLAKVIVIDNDSQDESLEYLRTLSWIELIERKAGENEWPAFSHSLALDIGLRRVKTPYVLSIHTDTLVKNPKWLEFLLSHLEKNENIAGVGSWKLEAKPAWRTTIKKIEHYLQLFYFQCSGRKQHGLNGVGKNHYYLRSHCALYRTELLRKLDLHFATGNMIAGRIIHKKLLENGYEMVFLPSEVLIKHLDHINHATTVLNPQLSSREKSVVKGLRRIEKNLVRLGAKEILLDASLDNSTRI